MMVTIQRLVQGKDEILIEGKNFVVLDDVLMLIVCLARLIHLRFFRALRPMMVTVLVTTIY